MAIILRPALLIMVSMVYEVDVKLYLNQAQLSGG